MRLKEVQSLYRLMESHFLDLKKDLEGMQLHCIMIILSKIANLLN